MAESTSTVKASTYYLKERKRIGKGPRYASYATKDTRYLVIFKVEIAI